MYYYYQYLYPLFNNLEKELCRDLNDKSYSFQKDIVINDKFRKKLDLVIYKNGRPLAAFEYRPNIYKVTDDLENENTFKEIKHYATLIDCRYYFLIIDDKILEYYGPEGVVEKPFTLSQPELIEKLKSHEDIQAPNRNEIANIQKLLQDLERENLYPLFQECLRKRGNSSNLYLDENSEQEFWNSILKKFPKNRKIYRYTSLESLFAMINNLSYRMCGIIGMNDTSEIDYFDKYCGNLKNNQITFHPDQNKKFISSFSTLNDKLTMWRLYGDDAKGVCLEYEQDFIDDSPFSIYKVDYAEKENNHKNLELIKALIKMGVRFKDIDRWKHFFKPYEYHVENEVRLLYINNDPKPAIEKHWVSTATHSIFNPVVDIPLSGGLLPLNLKRIILGAKCPEKETNSYQIQEMLNDKIQQKFFSLGRNLDQKTFQILSSLGNVTIEISKIKNYR